MSPQTLTLTSHTAAPVAPRGSLSTVQRTPTALVARSARFAAPVVRELPPRREARAAAGVW